MMHAVSVEGRRAPAAARALQVLETLAADPTGGLTLTELRNALGFSHGNLHAILATMEAAGHVRRDPATRAYTVGPALLAIGTAARTAYPSVEAASPYMQELARDLDTECRASMRLGDEILVVARVGPLQPPGYGVTVGERFPLTPPLGLTYIAWSSPEDVEAYLASAADHLAADEVERYRDAIAALRQRGYAVNLEAGPRQQLSETASRIVAEASRERYEDDVTALAHELGHHGYALVDSDAVDVGQILHVGAPVFGASGSVELVVGVSYVTPHLAGRTVADVRDRLLATTTAIMQTIGGRAPAPPR